MHNERIVPPALPELGSVNALLVEMQARVPGVDGGRDRPMVDSTNDCALWSLCTCKPNRRPVWVERPREIRAKDPNLEWRVTCVAC